MLLLRYQLWLQSVPLRALQGDGERTLLSLKAFCSAFNGVRLASSPQTDQSIAIQGSCVLTGTKGKMLFASETIGCWVIELRLSPTLCSFGETLTMAAWVVWRCFSAVIF